MSRSMLSPETQVSHVAMLKSSPPSVADCDRHSNAIRQRAVDRPPRHSERDHNSNQSHGTSKRECTAEAAGGLHDVAGDDRCGQAEDVSSKKEKSKGRSRHTRVLSAFGVSGPNSRHCSSTVVLSGARSEFRAVGGVEDCAQIVPRLCPYCVTRLKTTCLGLLRGLRASAGNIRR